MERRFLSNILLTKLQEWKCFLLQKHWEKEPGKRKKKGSWETESCSLKACTPLRLKPHCFSSTRWYFLSVGLLGGCWVEHQGGTRVPCQAALQLTLGSTWTSPPLLSACQARQKRDISRRKKSWPVVGSWRAERCSGRLPQAATVGWDKMRERFWRRHERWRAGKSVCRTASGEIASVASQLQTVQHAALWKLWIWKCWSQERADVTILQVRSCLTICFKTRMNFKYRGSNELNVTVLCLLLLNTLKYKC